MSQNDDDTHAWMRQHFAQVDLDTLGQGFADASGEIERWDEEWIPLGDWEVEAARDDLTVTREVVDLGILSSRFSTEIIGSESPGPKVRLTEIPTGIVLGEYSVVDLPSTDLKDVLEYALVHTGDLVPDEGDWREAQPGEAGLGADLDRWVVQEGKGDLGSWTYQELEDSGVDLNGYPGVEDEILLHVIREGLYSPSPSTHAFPFAWNTCWILYGWSDQDYDEGRGYPRILVEEARKAGFLVYGFRDNIVLGIDGGGYDMLSQHWAPFRQAMMALGYR